MAAQIVLDVCTPEGKTWLARLTGLGGQFGVQRQFQHGRSDLSRSGKTGSITYTVTDGIYESNEGRRSLRPHQRKWWRVTGDQAAQITEADALAELDGAKP